MYVYVYIHIYIYVYIYTHTHARTHKHMRKLCVLAITLCLEDEADGWCVWKGDKIKATSFHNLQSKARKEHQHLRVQPARREQKHNREQSSDDEDSCVVCVSRPGPAGYRRGDNSKKRLHIVHSQLSCRFQEASRQDRLKPNAAAVTFAVLRVPQVIQCLPIKPPQPSNPKNPFPHWKHTPGPSFLGPLLVFCVGSPDILIR